MKKIILAASAILLYLSARTQVIDIDLSDKKAKSVNIDLELRSIRLTNLSKNFIYELDWQVVKTEKLPFDIKAFASNDSKFTTCSQEVQDVIIKLDSENDEGRIKSLVENGRKLIDKLGAENCAAILKKSIEETEQVCSIPFTLTNNQVITLTISKIAKNGKKDSDWSYTLKTPEKSRWLIHYGLTYVPNVISKVNHYFSQADTGATNKYTITKENNNGPKPWENISATINFTYPFSAKSKDLDGGFTAGFGLNPGFEVSGHAGISAIIGENIIIGTGVAFLQKYKLMGEYRENQVVKTNLNFEALHHKVWLPELYFTIGFRFNSNPFAKKTTDNTSAKPTEPTK